MFSPFARAGIGDINSEGWTILAPSADSILVYVSSSDGDDANDGLSPETPKQTIDGANALIRDGYPDWMLLKRGDTFAQGSIYRWKNGRSATEPLVMTYYGESGPRPLIKLTKIFVNWDGFARNHTAFVGLDLYRSVSDPSSPDFDNSSAQLAFRFIPVGEHAYDVLVEDCVMRFCGIVTQGDYQSEHFIYNAQHRRNFIANVWGHNTDESNAERPQGIFVSKVIDLVLEENAFHHNGWNEDISDAKANTYNHNVYLNYDIDGDILVRGNVISYGSGSGLQLRSGGTAEMNAIIGNSVGLSAGYFSPPTYYTGDTFVRDNVITDGRPQVPDDTTSPQTGAIWGIWKQLIDNTYMDNNIVANILDDRGGYVIPYNEMTANELGSGNIAWNWVANDDPATNPGWPDPTRNAAGFADSLGLADYDMWIELAMTREVGKMPFGLTAYAYNNYVRAGFGKGPVAAPYNYDLGLGDGGGPVAVTGVVVYPGDAEMLVNDSVSLGALILPSNAADNSVVWSTSDPTVASVNTAGVVTATGSGSAVVTATTNDGGYQDFATITVQELGENIALNKPTMESIGEGGDVFELVDGLTDASHRWAVQGFPQWAEIDLGADYELSLFRLYPYIERDYQYTIAVAKDGSDEYEIIVDRSGNTEIATVLTDSVDAIGRYVLLIINGAATYDGPWVGINELEVYGTLWTGGSGTETLSNLNASSTDYSQSGSFEGDNGETWSYEWSKLIGLGITDQSIELRHFYGVLETTLPDGFDELSFQISTIAGAAYYSAPVEVFVDDVSQGIFQPEETDVAKTITLTGLNKVGPTSIRFVKSTWGQVWIDNISWSTSTASSIAVTGIELTPGFVELAIGSSVQLTTSVLPADATDKSVLWESSDDTVASVNSSGLVTAVAGGSATIYATTVDGGWVDTSSISVPMPDVVPGDMTGDGVVDATDLSLVRAALGSRVGDSNYIETLDYDHDGVISRSDYAVWYGFARR